MRQISTLRAATVVAVAALLEAVLAPYLEVGWVSPKFVVLGVVFAVWGMQELQGILLGFFGGILIDALGSGLFGVGALGGVIAGWLSVRAGGVRRQGSERLLLTQVLVASVLAYDLISFVGIGLAGLGGPSVWGYVFTGLMPDALLNGLLAYLAGPALLQFVRVKEGR